jgi:outer membrane receptor protein involved in Fe transport
MKFHMSTKALAASVSAFAMMATSSAFAQDAIDEIIITATKRPETLQDVSLSVTALDEAALERAGIQDVSRLELVVPGVNFAFAGNDAKFNVRGANSSNTFGDNGSIVGAFVDGVYKNRASQQTRALFDVQRLEFLRGPQGTLYGRNTFAGALNVITNAPDFEETSAGVDVTYQRFDRLTAEGFVNIPLGENVALRVAGQIDKGDGYIQNVAGPDIGAQDERALRATLAFNPTDQLSVTARFSHAVEDGLEAGLFGYTFLCRNETPEGITDPFGSVQDCTNPVRGSGGRGTAANDPNGGDPYRIAQDYVRPVNLQEDVLSLHVDYDFGPATFRSITSYTDFINDIDFDFDFSPTPNSNGAYDEEQKAFTQEFQVVSNGSGPLAYTLGAFYSNDELRQSFSIYQQTQRDDSTRGTAMRNGQTFTLLDGTDIVSEDTLIGGFFADNAIVDTDYFGIFGQVEYSVSEQLRLIGGLRYNDESKELSCGGSNFSGGDRVVNVDPRFNGGQSVVLPNRASEVFTFNCGAADQVRRERSYDNVTWRAGVEYDVNDDVMVYATGATGYLSGSLSTGAETDEQESQVFEGGLRSVLADGRLLLNGAAHFTTYDNLLTQRQRIEGGLSITESVNGGEIDAWGVEIDAQYQPTNELFFNVALAYLNSEFGEFGQNNPYQLLNGQVQSFVQQDGNRTPWSPELTASIGGGYDIDMGDKGVITPYVQFYYSDGYNTSNLLATDPSHDQDSFTKTDIRVSWESASTNYGVEVFVENIEDEAVLARGNNNSDDIVQTGYLYPRNYGIRFKSRF